ncbi:MAG: TonB-dependent receptor, partial [Gammaproteobacteria bacterium]
MSIEPHDQMDDEDSLWRRHGPLAGGLLAVLAIGLGLYVFFGKVGGGQPPKPPEVQQISIVQPPPPPPPPPQVEEPPPPEMEEVEVPEPEPEPIADDAPADEPLPGDDLGLDADGVAGADGFGLKARKGGRALIGGGDRNKWYAGVIQTDLQALLADIE